MRWEEFERAAPDLAARGCELIERHDFVMVGTLTKDGAPRVNPVEAYIVAGELTMNMMFRSRKALDLLRDPRILVHTIVTRRDGDEGEFKIRGRAVVVEDEHLRSAISDRFQEKIDWRPPPESHFFAIDVESVAWVRYEDGTQHMTRWDPVRGERRTVRDG